MDTIKIHACSNSIDEYDQVTWCEVHSCWQIPCDEHCHVVKYCPSCGRKLSIADNVYAHLEAWILDRESDIAFGDEDFGELYDVFVMLFGREPEKYLETQSNE